MKKLFFSLSILSAFLFSSCMGPSFISSVSVIYPPTKECFTINNLNDLMYKYEEIGIVKTERSKGHLNPDDLKELQDCASDNGADAIINAKKDGKTASATAIRFLRNADGVPLKRY